MAVIQDIRLAKSLHEQAFFQLPNVVGVGIGYKVTKGNRTNDLALIVYVKSKVGEQALALDEIVPKTLSLKSARGADVEIQTDVIQTGDFTAKPAEAGSAADSTYRQRHRPVQAGYSIGPAAWSGTLGAFVVQGGPGGPLRLLSCNHVLVNGNASASPIFQPGGADGGQPSDKIGQMVEFQKLAPGDNHIDAAIAELDSSVSIDLSYPEIGIVGYDKNPVGVNQVLRKVGRTTGLTSGVVQAVDVALNVQYSFGTFHFVNQVTLHPGNNPVAQHGDSGSVFLDEYGYARLLFFALSESSNIVTATPIGRIMDRFQLDIASGWQLG